MEYNTSELKCYITITVISVVAFLCIMIFGSLFTLWLTIPLIIFIWCSVFYVDSKFIKRGR